jgi:CRP-like cAMP-binding protein
MLLTVERVLFLKQVDLFANVDDDVLVNLAMQMVEEEFKAGERIITEGDMGRELFIIVDGKVRVHKGDVDLATLGSKAVVGELAALDPEPRTASVTALEDCNLLRLEHTLLFEELLGNNELARGIIRFLVRRFRDRQQ